MQLNHFDNQSFLRDNWQRKPLLIRNPWTSWDNPIEADELAGLACEEHVESRLITQSGENLELEHGPFADSRFGELGKENWTLLVQAVDHFVPEVAALIEPFRFIPNWRIDDVMVSFAADGGGVGPHFDQYDVFLIQGAGKRRWQLGEHCDENSETLPHDNLRLLANFEAKQEWICEPGDILYVPPGIAHNGTAIGDDCMTYSIGFRAPSRSELIGYWCDDLLAEMQDDDRYTDAFGAPDQKTPRNPGEITAGEVARLHKMITDKLSDRDAFAQWFGQYVSTRKYPDIDWQPDELFARAEIRERLMNGQRLHRNPASRLSFIRKQDGVISLFADGVDFDCTGNSSSIAQQICAQDEIIVDPAAINSDGVIDLISALRNQGSVMFEEES